MMGSDSFVQGYNAQAAVEPALQLIVGQSVTPVANDKEQVAPMAEVIEQQSGQRPTELLADSGYCSEQNLEHLETVGESGQPVNAYVATGKQKQGDRQPCPRGPVGHQNSIATVERLSEYRQSSATYEPHCFQGGGGKRWGPLVAVGGARKLRPAPPTLVAAVKRE